VSRRVTARARAPALYFPIESPPARSYR